MLFKNKFFNKYLAFIFVITFLFVIDTVHAYPDMKEQGADETASESTDNSKEEKADPKNLKECKMQAKSCLLYTSPSPRDSDQSRMPSSA